MKYNLLLLAFCVMLFLLSCEKAPTTAAQNPEPIPTFTLSTFASVNIN